MESSSHPGAYAPDCHFLSLSVSARLSCKDVLYNAVILWEIKSVWRYPNVWIFKFSYWPTKSMFEKIGDSFKIFLAHSRLFSFSDFFGPTERITNKESWYVMKLISSAGDLYLPPNYFNWIDVLVFGLGTNLRPELGNLYLHNALRCPWNWHCYYLPQVKKPKKRKEKTQKKRRKKRNRLIFYWCKPGAHLQEKGKTRSER